MKLLKSGLQQQARSTVTPFAGARQVCEAIHGDYGFTVVCFKRKKVTNAVDDVCGPLIPAGRNYFSHDSFDEHFKRFPQYQDQGFEVFAVVAASDGEGHGDANVQHTWALAVDFDHGYPEHLVGNQLIGPSFRVRTSPGHYQAVWVLDVPCKPEYAKPVLVAMALRLGGDVAYAKASQLLRLPGFTHHKHGTVPKLVEVITREKPYTLQFLKQAFDVEVIQNHLRLAVPRLNARFEVKKDKSNEEDEAQVLADIESALPYLKAFADDYKGWFSTLSSLARLGERGKQLAERFSRYSAKFNAEAFERKWAEVQKHPGYVGTIFLRAQANGWANPGFRKDAVPVGQAITERLLGRMIATKMGDDFAATESLSRGTRQLTFYKFGVTGYVPMSDIEKRTSIEAASTKVIADIKKNTNLEAKAIHAIQYKFGTNSKLNAMSEHVADVLVPESERRKIGSHPYIVVANGVLNLLSLQMVPAKYRAVPVKGASPVVYDPSANAPVFEKTLDEVFEGDKSMIRYFMQVIGYLMLGAPKEQIFLILFGPTAGNGKNTVLDAIEFVMGGYAMKLPPSAILAKSQNNDAATPAAARMDGKRMVVVSEPNEKHPLDSGAVKSMVGDLTMPVRDNYEAAKDIMIEFVLVMLANKLPKVQADDHGIWRRAKIIPFNRTFRGNEVDRDLPAKLRNEAAGILNLLLAGAQDYFINGLQEPAKVTKAIQAERQSVDTVAAFLNDTMRTGVNDDMPLKMIFAMYEDWRPQNYTFTRLTKPGLSKALVEKGYKKSMRGNLPYFHGLTPIEIPD